MKKHSVNNQSMSNKSISNQGISNQSIGNQAKATTTRQHRPRLKPKPYKALRYFQKSPNTLIIGDLHAPFTLKGYLDFCLEIQARWFCDDVIFTGDILDNHFSSFHNTNPDGLSAKDELDKAMEIIGEYHEAFPNAWVVLGNHDLIPQRKIFNAGLSKHWLRPINEVIDTPSWNFVSELYINDRVLVTHGDGMQAKGRATKNLTSVIQGHSHTKSYIEYTQGHGMRTFAMQVGCGIDRTNPAFDYAKNNSLPHINVGVLINNETPLLQYMDLDSRVKGLDNG